MPCRMYAPIFDEVSKMDKYKDTHEFVCYDTEEHSNKAREYNVTSVPATILVDENGGVLGHNVGAMPSDLLEQFIDNDGKL